MIKKIKSLGGKVWISIVENQIIAHGERIQMSWNKKNCLTTRRKHVPFFFVYLVTKSHCIHNGQFQSNITFLEFICLSFKSNMRVKMWGFMVFKISIKQCINQRWFSNSSLPWKKQRYIFTGARDGWEKIEL